MQILHANMCGNPLSIATKAHYTYVAALKI